MSTSATPRTEQIPAAEDLIPAREAARRMGVKPHTAAVWRTRGIGPAYVRFGDAKHGRVYYRAEDVAEFLAARTFRCTAAETLAAANAEAARR